MSVNERDKLIEEYRIAVQRYSEAVSRLIQLDGLEFKRAYDAAELLRQESERCRAALERLNTGR